MLFVCLLFYCRKYRFIWRFEVFAAVGAIKSLILLSNALKSHLRRSNGKRKVVSGLARNLIGSKIASATAKNGAVSNSKKKEHRRCGGDVVLRVFMFVDNRHIL